MHYGVMGMKWGMHRAASKINKNNKLAKKSFNYDKKSYALLKKSEKAHNKFDLGERNKAMIKAAKQSKRSEKLKKKGLKITDESKYLKTRNKAAKLEYKAAKNIIKGERLSKTTGYGAKAMSLSVRSDKFAVKAAKARKKIYANDRYVDMMNQRINKMNEKSIKKGKKYTEYVPIEYTRGQDLL